MIYPELASNKKVSYKSSDESICTIDENGVITGVHYGSTTVMVTTEDGNKIAMMNIRVKADIPYDVSLSHNELSMVEGSIFKLDAVVDAPVAVNKNVTYQTSDPSVVKVDATGKLTAVSKGTAVITVTTVSGGITDTCTVTVTEGVLPMFFDFEGVNGITLVNGVYELSMETIDLALYLKLSDEVDPDQVVIKIQSGSAASIDGSVLTFNKANGLVTVKAYVGNENNPTHVTEIKLVYKG